MKIVFFDITADEERYFKEQGFEKAVYVKEPLTKERASKFKDAEIVSIFVHSKIDEEVLREMPKLRYVTTRSMGFDHIDVCACQRHNVKASNVPHYGGHTVAEHTFALILALARKINYAIDRAKDENFSITGLEGFDLAGKIVGIIGPGRIGQEVMRIANGFSMKILVCGTHKDKELEKKFGARFVSLDKLLASSEIITLHVPLCETTKHLINKGNVLKIKKGAYLINTSRGPVVDTEALIYALDKKIIAGAGLDVLEGEEIIREETELIRRGLDKQESKLLLENHALLRKHNVVVTPHIAFYTKEAVEKILEISVLNLKNIRKGKVINNIA